MARIGRNDPCPCGSGKKFKKCCINNTENLNPNQPAQITLQGEVDKLIAKAENKEKYVFALGVFVLFSTTEGDAWLLEISDMDAVQVAIAGEKQDVEIVESSETIEVNWPYKFAIKDKKLVTTSYLDNAVKVWESYPTQQIAAAIKRVRKKFPQELLDSIHVDEAELNKAAEATEE